MADVVQVISEWAAANEAKLAKIYKQKGGWEGWAQVELTSKLAQQFPGAALREVAVYVDLGPRPRTADILLGPPFDIIELKCESLNQDIPPSKPEPDLTAFARQLELDIIKIRDNHLKTNYTPSWIWVIGITIKDEISDATATYNFPVAVGRVRTGEHLNVWWYREQRRAPPPV
ncbi:hypothetical protein DL93DRAFT_2078740 [Clavulina sp. PMI_390]|nr:hypothetical protein DL93DRAFT_2078740 [Clavulina sp. PMI_390]